MKGKVSILLEFGHGEKQLILHIFLIVFVLVSILLEFGHGEKLKLPTRPDVFSLVSILLEFGHGEKLFTVFIIVT